MIDAQTSYSGTLNFQREPGGMGYDELLKAFGLDQPPLNRMTVNYGEHPASLAAFRRAMEEETEIEVKVGIGENRTSLGKAKVIEVTDDGKVTIEGRFGWTPTPPPMSYRLAE